MKTLWRGEGGGVNERKPFEFRRKPELLKQSEATGGHSLDGAAAGFTSGCLTQACSAPPRRAG